MIFYCPNCWNEIPDNTNICPVCFAVQSELLKEDFEKKLIRALYHPEPETPIRATMILGKLKSQKAVPELIKLFEVSSDIFLKATILKSLKAINNHESIKFINGLKMEYLSVIEKNEICNK